MIISRVHPFAAQPSFRFEIKFRRRRTCRACMDARLPFRNTYRRGIYVPDEDSGLFRWADHSPAVTYSLPPPCITCRTKGLFLTPTTAHGSHQQLHTNILFYSTPTFALQRFLDRSFRSFLPSGKIDYQLLSAYYAVGPLILGRVLKQAIKIKTYYIIRHFKKSFREKKSKILQQQQQKKPCFFFSCYLSTNI